MNTLRMSLLVVMLALTVRGVALAQKRCVIAFYNVENLFDTKDAPGKEDEAFTPNGEYRYTNEIYSKKLHNIATVLQGMAVDDGGPAVIGLAEVENDVVLRDLCNQPEIKSRGYKYVWYDGPDLRGIDVALLYNPKMFTVSTSVSVPVQIANKTGGEHTRNILLVNGKMRGRELYILVNHWPSRREGQHETEDRRKEMARANKRLADSLMLAKPGVGVVIMGDLNDNPNDRSVVDILQASSQTQQGKLYNPWANIYSSGRGTSRYKQSWELFDQIIISSNLSKAAKPGDWYFEKAVIYNPEMIQDRYSKLKGAPYRSFKGTFWVNGYSDHFPVMLYLAK